MENSLSSQPESYVDRNDFTHLDNLGIKPMAVSKGLSGGDCHTWRLVRQKIDSPEGEPTTRSSLSNILDVYLHLYLAPPKCC